MRKTDPLRRLEAEHRDALAALARLEQAAAALEAGEAAAPHLAVAREVYDLLTTAVRRHNENEERALFPVLGEDAPTHFFEEDHRVLRSLEHQLAAALAAPDAATRVAPVARTIVDLLCGHIQREDEVLFPMARVLLGSEGLARVAARLAAPEGESR